VEKKEPLSFITTMPLIEGSYKGNVDTLDELVKEAFTEAIKRVLSTGKTGKLTVTMAFSRKDDFRIEITGDVTTKLPEFKSDIRSIYHDQKGNLFLDDPRQANLPFSTPLKQVKQNQEAA
jgi:hypothetical protein